jgi:hypothetical protein
LLKLKEKYKQLRESAIKRATKAWQFEQQNNLISQAELAEKQRLQDGKPKKKDPRAVELGRKGGKKGGRARFEGMTEEEKRELGQRGARARWAAVGVDPAQIPKAIAEGVLKSGIQCAVIEGERRVLSRRGVGRALGRVHAGSDFGGGEALPFFLNATYLKPYISDELRVEVTKPILYHGDGGKR